jgi:hypothetical protein
LSNTDQNLSLAGVNFEATSVSPFSLSPVLRQSIEITFDSTVPASYYDVTKFTTFLNCIDMGCDYTELEMFVESVDASNN